MTIETHEEYEAAIDRLKAMGENLAEGAEQDEFFEISAKRFGNFCQESG